MEAEDIIEMLLTEQLRHNFRYTHWIAQLSSLKFEIKLRKVRTLMDSIAEEAAEMKNSIKFEDAQIHDSVEASSSSSSSSSSSLVADTGKLKMPFATPPNPPNIWHGRYWETTLAGTVYDDPLIREHFQIRAWVTVSQDHSEREILSDLLDSMREFDAEWRKESTRDRSEEGNESLLEIPEMSNTEMALKVHKILVGRRFLIVMDDI
ncbi:disease resistance RPP8-like protein 3 [Salvia splendens]|uniref:disease resistance RPP8-like protein 3 n=1 Tax=Salvia splendens TaxID=180675 RepID=UPI001C27976E|nr:disease resistance RPP8-like protein 3 [Salvia splendens]